MSAPVRPVLPGPIEYPESDGQPMADSSKQFDWILFLAGNIRALFRDRADVFVCGNQFWYPVEGEPSIVAAPDVYVVFGRPKGHRPSWKQWEEGGLPMTVVFEVRSPKNSDAELEEKFEFYDEHGVEEYYLYDPEKNTLEAYVRGMATLRRMRPVDGFISPRLGIRFQMTEPEMTVYLPNGEKFRSIEETEAERQRYRERADQANQRADQANQRADQAKLIADQSQARMQRFAALSRKARLGQATPDEVAELERLENESAQPPP